MTLRHLMAHRSGLVREPPAGHYFDDRGTGLAETVASLNGTRLVYAPGARTKYSNAGVAVVGRVLEAVGGAPFARLLERTLLEPLGMERSSFEARPDLVERLAGAWIWTWDGREFGAPTFPLGMAPAGSMYATVTDLAHFLATLFAGGLAPGGRVVSAETLGEMWTPQFAEPDAEEGFGLGFALGRLDGERVVRHGGAIYGFATELAALPDAGLGVVVATTVDGANAVTARVATAALGWMLDLRGGAPLRAAPRTSEPLAPAVAEELEGRYGDERYGVDLLELGGRLWLEPVRGGSRSEVRRLAGDTLVADGRLAFGPRLVPVEGGLEVDGRLLVRRADEEPAPSPRRLADYIGEYGWDHNVLYVLEKEGRLHALIEWFFLYPLEAVAPDRFAFPSWGLYDGEELVFRKDAAGRVDGVVAASVHFPRRAVGTAEGETFRIDPVRPVAELREAALAADPPEEEGPLRAPDLVEVVALDSTIHLDVRYAGTNNFMGARFYDAPRAFLQRPAAEALVREAIERIRAFRRSTRRSALWPRARGGHRARAPARRGATGGRPSARSSTGSSRSPPTRSPPPTSGTRRRSASSGWPRGYGPLLPAARTPATRRTGGGPPARSSAT